MKKREVTKKLLAFGMMSAMIMSMAGCGDSGTPVDGSGSVENTQSANGGESAGSSTKEGGEGSSEQAGGDYGELGLVTIYPSNAATSSGLVTGYKADILARRGIQVEVWAYSEEKSNGILASGDLPDIMYVNYDNMATLIESGKILNLGEYLTEEKLPHVVADEPLMTALNYVKEFRSADTGELYGIPAQVGVFELPKDNGIWADTGRNAVKVNWDAYYAAGCPEIKSVDDLIPVMKKMMETTPTAEDGTKTWGTMLNSGSDATYWGNMQLWNKWFGYESDNLPYLIESDMVNGKYSSLLETGKDSLYYKGLKWYNQCMREGVMDPDSINNDRETQKAKVEKSLACMIPSGTCAGWAGYLPVYVEGQQLFPEKWVNTYGTSNYLVVSADCQDLDATLRAVDMLADADTFYEIVCGPEGILWEYGEDGLVKPTEYGLDVTINGKEYDFNGEKPVLWMDSDRLTSSAYSNSYMGPDGAREHRGLGEWTEVKEVNNNSDSYVQWRETFGYDRFYDQVVDKAAYHPFSDLDDVINFCPQPDDVMQLTIDAIKETVVAASWNMVYAKDDAEFEKIWDQMIQDCIDLNAGEVIQWRMDELEKAKGVRDSLKAK